jgi:hypothetical protein
MFRSASMFASALSMSSPLFLILLGNADSDNDGDQGRDDDAKRNGVDDEDEDDLRRCSRGPFGVHQVVARRMQPSACVRVGFAY